MNNKVQNLCISAVLSALVLAATFINVRSPFSATGGLMHLGNVPLVVAAILFGKKNGAAAGAIGMSLFDLLSPWVVWAPFTFVVRGAMGYTIGAIAEKKRGKSMVLNAVAIVAGGLLMMIGYYLTEAILYGNMLAPLHSVSGNAVQVFSALVLGLPLVALLQKQKIVGRFPG